MSHRWLIVLGLMFACTATARADVALPHILSDNMCLQQDKPVPIWGWAKPDEKITVSFAGQTKSTAADKDGNWMVTLDPLATSDQGAELIVKGDNTLTLKNVIVGEVWLASGQSNMQFTLNGAQNAKDVIPKATDASIRLYTVYNVTAPVPQKDLPPGKWVICSPANAAPFSAVAYFFGTELRQTLHRPVGLIDSSWGGTRAESWISPDGLRTRPELAATLKQYRDVADHADELHAKFQKDQAEYAVKHDQWLKEGGAEYLKAAAEWAKAAHTPGTKPSPAPKPPTTEPLKPSDPTRSTGTPTTIYNQMIAPLIPYAIRGVIWYQGESNAGQADLYRTLFPAMIEDWRARWAQRSGQPPEGDFAFLFVQLANYMQHHPDPTDTMWAHLREAQLMALSVPKTGMAVIVDLGDAGNIHPKDKEDVGHRLALIARHDVYGEKDLVYSGPIFTHMEIKDGNAICHFSQTGTGLAIGTPPPAMNPGPALDHLRGFAIAGKDMKFVWADAKIDGDTVVVHSDQLKEPVAVRYDWDDNPDGNLYNKEGLPASPFRTDGK